MDEYIEKSDCCIHSLGGALAEATIVAKVGDNQYIAEYGGKRCTAIFNLFVGKYYVDDKYGVITQEDSREHTPISRDEERMR
jgi:hypothetical protein